MESKKPMSSFFENIYKRSSLKKVIHHRNGRKNIFGNMGKFNEKVLKSSDK